MQILYISSLKKKKKTEYDELNRSVFMQIVSYAFLNHLSHTRPQKIWSLFINLLSVATYSTAICIFIPISAWLFGFRWFICIVSVEHCII